MRGGLLARVQQQGEAKKDAPVTASTPSQPPNLASASSASAVSPAPSLVNTQAAPALKRKPLAMGGLLARVQQRALPRSPSPRIVAPPEETSTPPPAKRARVEGGAQGVAADPPSSQKQERPAQPVKKSLADLVTKAHGGAKVANGAESPLRKMQESQAHKASEVSSVSSAARGGGAGARAGSFYTLADTCCSEAEDLTTALAACLREVVKGAGEGGLGVAMSLLTPVKVVSSSLLAKAISEAFKIPHRPTLRGSALAALAVDGRHRRPGLCPPKPLIVKDVAQVISKVGGAADDDDSAVKTLTSLLERTQMGLEPFYVVLALQGQLAPNTQVVHSALARAIVPGLS